MKTKYLDALQALLAEVHYAGGQFEFKTVFGAVGGYIDGSIFISCGSFGVALRLPSKILEDLFKEPDVTHLKYFPKGHIKKEYAVLPARILQNKKQFTGLVDISIRYVNTI